MVDQSSIIREAIRIAGSQPKLARRAQLSQQHISKLLLGERRVTAEIAIAIEAATDGGVARWELRPDLWTRTASAA